MKQIIKVPKLKGAGFGVTNDKAEQPPGFFGGLIEPLVMRNRRQKGIYDSDTRHVSRRNRQVLLKVYIDVYGR